MFHLAETMNPSKKYNNVTIMELIMKTKKMCHMSHFHLFSIINFKQFIFFIIYNFELLLFPIFV